VGYKIVERKEKQKWRGEFKNNKQQARENNVIALFKSLI